MVYTVKKPEGPLEILTEAPGSKSITNRALLMAAMAKGESVLEGVLFSDDSKHFLQALTDLGYPVEIDENHHRVRITGGEIPKKEAKVFVGSAGTAARFLTAFLACSDGVYQLDATEQMKKRPMKELLVALTELGAGITYLEEEYTFPFIIEGLKKKASSKEAEVVLNIDQSSQFLSALLMVAPICFSKLTIHLSGTRNARSYVEMTEQMMMQFGHKGVAKVDEDSYQVDAMPYQARVYGIEPDVSAACYFYAMAAVTGGSAIVKYVRQDSLQGDMKFLSVLQQMGCTILETDVEGMKEKQIKVIGPKDGKLKGITASFSDFSDQTLTAAAIAPFADSKTEITGIAHIRGQESDRIHVIYTELLRMGIRCEERTDGVVIYPGKPHAARIETYQDHRVAMAFAITGLGCEGIEISNPSCCKKTFPEFFEVFDDILEKNSR